MKKRINVLLSVFVFVFTFLSIAMFIIPEIDDQIYSYTQNTLASEYDLLIKNSKERPQDNTAHKTTKKHSKKIELERLKEDIKLYNKRIYLNNQIGLNNLEQNAPLNLIDYGFPNNIYGYLTVDTINLKMAIYLGANEYNMSLGAACLTNTSIPYGNINTNSVICGHCGYGGRKYFRYIENLSSGDLIKITIPFGTKKYKVINKKIITPSDYKSIQIKKGEDLITLLTCYPYPTSDYRVCVICKAVPPRDNERK